MVSSFILERFSCLYRVGEGRPFVLAKPMIKASVAGNYPILFHGQTSSEQAFLRGVVPARRGPFVSAKGPKTIGARAWPQGVPVPRSRFLRLRNSLRSDSPRPKKRCGTGAQPRPQAPGNGICSFCHARLDRASSVFGFFIVPKDNDAGAPMTNVGDNKRSHSASFRLSFSSP